MQLILRVLFIAFAAYGLTEIVKSSDINVCQSISLDRTIKNRSSRYIVVPSVFFCRLSRASAFETTHVPNWTIV